jgi:phage gpG-like protein
MAHIVVSGVRELNAALEGVVAKQRAATRQATAKALHLIEKEAKAQLSKTSSSGDQGRDGKGRFTKRGSTSSPPGDPPFLITGNLRRSVRVTGPDPVGSTGWRGQTGPTAVYGRIQELGGVTGRGTLPARPYMQPAWDKVSPLIAPIYRAAWLSALA